MTVLAYYGVGTSLFLGREAGEMSISLLMDDTQFNRFGETIELVGSDIWGNLPRFRKKWCVDAVM